MKPVEDLKIGDVVQIDPEHDPIFGGCFMLVEELMSWGAQGMCPGPGKNGLAGTGVAYYRCTWSAMQRIGKAEWFPGQEEEETDANECKVLMFPTKMMEDE